MTMTTTPYQYGQGRSPHTQWVGRILTVQTSTGQGPHYRLIGYTSRGFRVRTITQDDAPVCYMKPAEIEAAIEEGTLAWVQA